MNEGNRANAAVDTTADFRKHIRAFADFPKPGVVYFDFTPLLLNPDMVKRSISAIKQGFWHASAPSKNITKIAAIEAKGFTIGAALAYELGLPLVLIRKPELSPGKVDSEKFVKEYGFGEYQIKASDVKSGDTFLIVYDIMAGAGATQAAMNLIERSGGSVAGCAYVIELEYLGGRNVLAADGRLNDSDIFSLVKIQEKPLITDEETLKDHDL